MRAFNVKCDDVRETRTSIGLPVGKGGNYPVKYHVWLPLESVKVNDYGIYYFVGAEDSDLYKDVKDEDDIITYTVE